MTENKELSIILPSYNDLRIERAICSIRKFDDVNKVRIVLVDGDSNTEVKNVVNRLLTDDDIYISERDQGIFDALNKGLDACDTEFIGWLGSDDIFTGELPASEVIEGLNKYDLYMGNINFFRNGYVTRRTHALPSRIGLTRLGLHNPHYATFGRASLLKSERFRLDIRGADIEYFVKIFDKKPLIGSTNVVATLQAEGGYSNTTFRNILRTNISLIPLFGYFGPFAVLIKLIYKTLSRTYFKIVRTPIP